MIILMIFGEAYKLQSSSLCSLCAISFLLDPNILFVYIAKIENYAPSSLVDMFQL